MRIILKQLTLKNFKGIKDLSIDFKNMTTISADNGVGKTTIFDAYTWLLFDKDSNNSSNFNIKTLDKDGQVIPDIEHSVEGVFLIDSKEISFMKIYKEEWNRII